jgi:dienelactone hydrolase
MRALEMPGARLYYETHGSGPLLVMIPGAGGAADVFRMVTEHLAAHYTVVIYDRRGFSRSRLDGPQDYDRRLETDADDVRRLVDHLGDGPAIVFGASSGAIVALALLTHHPSVVRTLVPFRATRHEIPAGRAEVGGLLHRDLQRVSRVRCGHRAGEVPGAHVPGVGSAGHGSRASQRCQRRVLVRARAALPGGHVGCVAHPAEFARELNRGISA